MKVTIHQPEHLPWLGFFHKMFMADVIVVLDNVQYRRRYFQNRNRIRTINGWQWITVPIEKENRDELLIKDAIISSEDLKWKKKNADSIFYNYSKAPFFNMYWEGFINAYNFQSHHLSGMNLSLIQFLMKSFGIQRNLRLASELSVAGTKGDLMLTICEAVGATCYISGISGREYFDTDSFRKSGINVTFQEFHHPIYKQLYEPFIPCMSSLDLLFNYGEGSLDIINGIGVPVMETVFK